MGSTSHHAFFDSSDSQHPIHPWGARPADDESPVARFESPVTTFGEKAYFTPYTSNYSSPVMEQDGIPSIGNVWPVERKTDIHSPTEGREWTSLDRKSSVASGSGKSSSRSRDAKEKVRSGGQFETQNVAPILMHPGHGRGGSTTSISLTEEDARRGAAL